MHDEPVLGLENTEYGESASVNSQFRFILINNKSSPDASSSSEYPSNKQKNRRQIFSKKATTEKMPAYNKNGLLATKEQDDSLKVSSTLLFSPSLSLSSLPESQFEIGDEKQHLISFGVDVN